MIRFLQAIMFMVVVVTFSISIILTYNYYKVTPSKMADTVVFVNKASGVIIYSDQDHSIILTSYHVIMNLVTIDGEYSGDNELYIRFALDNIAPSYIAHDIEVDSDLDLALITIKPGFKLHYSRIANASPSLADEIYTIGNPNYNYRTVTKGIISSKNRVIRGAKLWQVDSGLIYGASGGGTFNMNGELIGISKSIDLLETNMCFRKRIDNQGIIIIIQDCYTDPISYIGFIVPLPEIKRFLLSNKFSYIL